MGVVGTRIAPAVLLLGIGASIASADPISLVRYERYVSAWALVYGPSGLVAVYDEDRQLNGADRASAEASYAATTARSAARLVDTIAADLHHLSGSGVTSAVTDGPEGRASASAILSFWFDLDEVHAFDFAADFSKSGFGSWQTHLIRSPDVLGGQILRFSAISNTGADQQLLFRGALDPGRYAFYIRGDASDSGIHPLTMGAGAFDFTFDMSPVPEPGSLLLLGTGALGLVARVRRRRRTEA